jgi:sulfur-oxidizing protein SoxY
MEGADMDKTRRIVLKLAGGAGALSVAAAAGLVAGRPAWAANRNDAAFQAKAVADALKSLGAPSPVESRDIVITAPDIAENGAVVPVAETSKIPNTESIAILAEKNPFPLAASFDIAPGADAYVSTRLKVGQTTDVRALVKAGGKYFTAAKEVKVTVGGCG